MNLVHVQPSSPALSAASRAVRTSVFASLQGRIEARRAAGGELTPLHIGDTYLAPVAAAMAAMAEGGAADLGLYGKVPGMERLRQRLAERRAEAGLEVARSAANVHVGCGCTHALFCAARALCDSGDDVLVVSPYWPLVVGVLQTCDVNPLEVPFPPAGELGAALEAARTPRTRAVYFVTPNNPDGRVFSVAELEQVAAFAERHDLWVLADEVYADFVYEGRHASIANLPGMARRTVTSYSLSKSHGLAGARIGYVVAGEEVIAATRRMSNHTVYNVPVPMQRAALAAVEQGEDWIVEARATYRAARDATVTALRGLGLAFDVPRGGSFVFVDLRPRLGEVPLQRLLEAAIDHGVLLAPGDAFGPYDGYARVCFTGAPLPAVLDGVARLGAALDSVAVAP